MADTSETSATPPLPPGPGVPLAPPPGRLLYKALDAVMTASLRPRRPAGECLRGLLSPRSPRSTRVASLVQLVDAMLPGAASAASRRLLRPGRLPFAAEAELLASGSGSTVLLLRADPPSLVVKAYRRTVGSGPDELARLALGYRGKFETVSSWYREDGRLVVPGSFLVLHGPLLARPAVACVQPYLEGEKRDLFEDFDDSELARLIASGDRLGRQIRFFARRTLEVRAACGLCVDLLGAGNVTVTGVGESRALRLIDYGIFDLGAVKDRSPAVSARIERRLGRLESLLETSSRVAGNPSPAGPSG